MKRTLIRLLTFVLLLAVPLGAAAQTTTNETSLSTAVTSNLATTVVVASATGAAAGRGVWIDREFMVIRSTYVSGTTLPVLRGGGGRTAITTHASGAPVWIGPVDSAFRITDRFGSCTSTNELYLPQINTSNGNRWNCNIGGQWYNERDLKVVTCRALLIADMVDQSCFIADQAYVVTKITEVHKTKEAGGTLTLIVRKNTGTQAPASGVALNTALDMAAAATDETVRTATLTTTAADALVAAGNRISLDFTDDTAGELAAVTVMVYLYPR